MAVNDDEIILVYVTVEQKQIVINAAADEPFTYRAFISFS